MKCGGGWWLVVNSTDSDRPCQVCPSLNVEQLNRAEGEEQEEAQSSGDQTEINRWRTGN